MQIRSNGLGLGSVSNAALTSRILNLGHNIRDNASGLALLSRAWGQKTQFARHRFSVYNIKYAVVGIASNCICISPNTAAVPADTRIYSRPK